MNDRFVHRTCAACAVLALAGLLASPASAQDPLKLFISVDMEGVGGIGTPSMTSSSGKD